MAVVRGRLGAAQGAAPPQRTALSAGTGNLEAIHIIKKTGGTLRESYLDEGFILDKKIGVGQVGGLVPGRSAALRQKIL